MTDDLASHVHARLRELKEKLEHELDDGADPDSYNVGWLEGSIYELARLAQS